MEVSAVPKPWELREETPAEPAAGCGDARERDHAHAPAREGDTPGGEVATHPTARLTEVTQRGTLTPRELTGVWMREAKESGTAAVDGGVFKTRPPSLRDMHTRIVRAEWAGGIPALRVAGQIDGWLGLILNAVAYAFAWVVRRPVRRWIFTLVVVFTIVIPVLTT